MKYAHAYEVNHLTKTVVVTRRFYDEATQVGTDAYHLMEVFDKSGFAISIYQRAPRTRKTNKPADSSKVPLLTYRMMESYIAMLDDADEMLDVFKSVREAAKSRHDRARYVNNWFRKEFPNYDAVPEFDDNYRIVHNPNPIAV